jgi:hypothetical protein
VDGVLLNVEESYTHNYCCLVQSYNASADLFIVAIHSCAFWHRQDFCCWWWEAYSLNLTPNCFTAQGT